MKYSRVALAVLLTNTLTLGCVHPVAVERTPSNAEVETARTTPLVQLYQTSAAAQAFIMSEPDGRGDRRALCRVNVANRPQLVPAFIPLDRLGSDETYGLPECQGPQLDHIAEVATKGSQPQVAVAALAVPAVLCVAYFGLGYAVGRFTGRAHREFRQRKGVGARTAVAVGGAAVAELGIRAGGRGMQVLTQGAPRANLFGALCTGAGLAVGYLLVPPR